MKKTIALFTALLCTALLLAGCDTASGPDAETTGKKKEVKLKEFTYEEIYCSPRYENDYVSPVLQQVLTYPAQDALYVYAGSAVSDAKPLWHSIYTREDGTLSVLHDPF